MYGFPDIFDMNKYVKGRDYQCVSPACQRAFASDWTARLMAASTQLYPMNIGLHAGD